MTLVAIGLVLVAVAVSLVSARLVTAAVASLKEELRVVENVVARLAFPLSELRQEVNALGSRISGLETGLGEKLDALRQRVAEDDQQAGVNEMLHYANLQAASRITSMRKRLYDLEQESERVKVSRELDNE